MRHETGTYQGRDGVGLFRQSWRPDAPARAAVVNLHGLGDHSGLHRHLVEHLVSRGMAVHACDLRGHGRSGGQRAYIERWGDYRGDLGALIRIVRRDEAGLPLFLIGNSLGGLVVLEYALKAPDGLAGVVAVAPALGKVGVPRPLMALGRVFSRVWPRFSLEVGMDLSGLSRDPQAAAEILADPLFHRRGTARLSTEVTAAIKRVNSGARALNVPLLLMHGGADRMVPPQGTRRFAARLQGGDHALLEYPGAYHALFADLDGPRALADLSAWIEARVPS